MYTGGTMTATARARPTREKQTVAPRLLQQHPQHELPEPKQPQQRLPIAPNVFL